MTNFEIINKVKNENTSVAVWYGTCTNWNEADRNENCNPNSVERVTGFFTTRKEAWDAIQERSKKHVAEFGQYDVFDLNKAVIDAEVIEGLDWEDFADEPDAFDDEKMYDLILSCDWCHEWEDLLCEVSYNYESVDGAILVVWGWETYIGYARMIHEIRYGRIDEDESICCPIDHIYRPQVSVVAKATELDGLSKAELCALLKKKLIDEGDWRWTAQARGYINSYLNDLKESARAEQEYALIQYAANDCDSEAVLKAFDKIRTKEFEAALGYFQKEYDAVPVDADGPNCEQDKQLNAVVEKYVEDISSLPY